MPTPATKKTDDQPTTPPTVKRMIDNVITLRRAGAWAHASIAKTVEAVKTTFGREKAGFATEDMFFGGRKTDDVRPGDYDECKSLASTLNSIEEIADDRDLASLERRFREMVALERIWDNLKSSEHLNDLKSDDVSADEALLNIAGLHPRAKIKLKKFFLVKAIHSLKRPDYNYMFSIENFNKVVYPEIDLRKEYAAQQIKLLFAEVSEALTQKPDEFETFVHKLMDEVLIENNLSNSLPEEAPELYKKRADKSEKPDAFIRRVYSKWLGKGLARPHVKALDLSLYQSLYKHGVPEDFDELLPKAAGRSVENLSKSDSEILENRRAAVRRAEAKRKQVSIGN